MGKPELSTDIESLKAKRTKDRSKATKLSNDLKRLYTQVDQGNLNSDRHELDYTIELAEGHLSQMEELNTQLSELGIEDESPHYTELHKAVGLGKRLLSDLKKRKETEPVVTQVVMPQNNFKLNFTLPKFNGDLMAWPEFWELYEASVHQNSAYSPVQKLYYLRQHLDGAAARSIQGLPLTTDSYEIAIQTLKERFGKDNLRKDTIIAKLLSLPAVGNTENLKSLRRLVDDVSAGVASLKILKAEHAGEVLLPVLKGKIPPSWRLQWARQRGQTTGQEQDEFSDFLLFLQKEVGYLEEAAQVPCSKTGDDNCPTAQKATMSVLNTQRVQTPPTQRLCPICKGSHRLDKCSRYVEMAVEDRWTTAKRVGACFRCLGRHFIKDCKSGNCRQCQGSHHTSLHRPQASTPATAPAHPTSAVPYSPTTPPPAPVPAPPTTRPSAPQNQRSEHPTSRDGQHSHPNMRYAAQRTKPQCYIQTALVLGRGPRGPKMLRALLDGGSDASYIRKTVAEEMGLEVIGSDTFACVGFQERAEEPRTYDRVAVDLQNRHGGEARSFELWCCDRLCAPLPPAERPTGLDENIELADDFSGGQVDVLIGADQYYKVVLLDCVILHESLRALDTIFGYVIHGKGTSTGQPTRHVYHCRQVEQMWDLDCIGITLDSEVQKLRPEPEWNSKEERYEMGLLWSSQKRPVSNLLSSSTRVNKMMGKLDQGKMERYDGNIIKLQQDGVVEDSPSDQDNDQNVFFLPHRGLYRDNKLRIVFDGSAKDGNGVSLNDYLESGENLLRRLVEVLLNFRTYPIACQADIQAAFHQISVKEEDRRYLQFIWKDKTLRFQRVPFGLTCSPYMLLRSIQIHLSRYEGLHPEICRKLAAGLYMDDIAVGFTSVEEASTQMDVVQNIFREASMTMHKVRLTGEPSEDSKILGMKWNTERDTLAVTIPTCTSPETKSQLLSVIAKPFDPLGVLSPWLIKGKILFQKTWLSAESTTWDSNLPIEIKTQVDRWWRETEEIEEVEIPRSILPLDEDTAFHVFCDASSKAYCAVVYAVHGGESQLVMAKSRLAPLKSGFTIPRLELMAALLGVRLMCFVKETIKVRASHVTYWTDSMDVLYWIKSNKPLKVFVGNRVSDILKLSLPEQWYHVSTEQNPADLGTRGVQLKNLATASEWLKGPSFLTHDLTLASSQNQMIRETEDAVKELKKTSPIHARSHVAVVLTEEETRQSQSCASAGVTSTHTSHTSGPFPLTDCSTLKQAVNRTSWVLRFIQNLRLPKEQRLIGPLRPEERRNALYLWIKLAQEETYSTELEKIRAQQSVPLTSPIRKLRPHLGEEGLLRATPRTGEPAVIILPDLRYITTLIIDHFHSLSFHQGVRSTLALLSSEYLVRRKTVQRVVQTCTRCRRYRALPYTQTQGALPSFRTEPSRSFESIGLDYFGPLHVDDACKVWGLLITCATTRAIHLEVVRSQSTEDLQSALRRFFAIRGTPSLIVSDNAKSFHKILGLLPASVRWRYIPEASPWWGGFWERLVGSVKAALKITLHQCHLTHDELVTLFYELAMHLNMRPLTEDVTDGLLTPAHFLFGVTHIQGVISPSVNPTTALDRAWRNRKRVAEHLIKRWTDEYLQTLRAWSTSPRGRAIRVPSRRSCAGARGRQPWPLAFGTSAGSDRGSRWNSEGGGCIPTRSADSETRNKTVPP